VGAWSAEYEDTEERYVSIEAEDTDVSSERYVSMESEDTEVSSERYVSMESEDTEERYVRARSMESSEKRYVRARSMESLEKRYVRARSFRDEDYSSRRVFLYSYPLQWGGEDKYDEEYKEKTASSGNGGEEKKKSIKELIVSIFRWGEVKVLVLRRFKHKLGHYIIACLPVGFKPPNALVSA